MPGSPNSFKLSTERLGEIGSRGEMTPTTKAETSGSGHSRRPRTRESVESSSTANSLRVFMSLTPLEEAAAEEEEEDNEAEVESSPAAISNAS